MATVGEKIKNWVVGAVADVTSLQVETYKVNITATASTDSVDLDKFIDSLKVEAAGGTVQVIMVTRAELDQDTRVLYSANMTEDDERFVKHHGEIFTAAASARSEMVQLALRFFKGDPAP